MSFYEFKLKSFAFHRQRNYDMEMQMIMTRKITLAAYWGFNGDPKQFPKREIDIFETSFDKESINKMRISEEHRQKFIDEMAEYNRVFNSQIVN